MPIEPLLAMLQDSNGNVRQAAVQVLGQQGERVPIEALLALLQDPDEAVRQAAVQVLGAQGERVPIESLLALLQDPDWDVRQAAVQALGAQGERVPIESLLALLQHPDWDVRQAAAEALKKPGKQVSIDALLLLLYEKDASIRQVAIEVLETQPERIPLEPFVELLADEDSDVRNATIQVLKKVAPQVLHDLVPQAMSILQGELVGNMFISLNQKFIADTISNLGLTSPGLLEKLTELLDHPYWQVRLKAIRALSQLRRNIPDAAIRRLLAFRRDPDLKMRAVREAADDALAEILSLEAGIEDDDE